MRKQGRQSVPLTAEEIKIVEEFIQNDLTYDEMATKVGMTKAQLRYKVVKYRKECANGNIQHIVCEKAVILPTDNL